MNIHPVTLRFSGRDEELEEGFLRHFYDHSLPVYRWGFLLGAVLYAAFGLLDAIAMPDVMVQ
ncbi:MAG: hypothetical protein DSZ23_01730, partial [Thermodesulfatator sp.]